MRLGLGLSLLSGQPLRALGLKDDNPRSRPGLGKASLNLLALLARASQGAFTGVVGNQDIAFKPGLTLSPELTLSLSALRFSEAPLSWVLETYVPALNNQPVPAALLLSGGGTHVFGGPTTEEVDRFILPLWRRMGMDVEYTEIAPGFHPNASGEVEISLAPNPVLHPLNLTTAFKPLKVGASAVIADLPIYLAEQTLAAAQARFTRHGFERAELNVRNPLSGQGQALCVWASNGNWQVGFSVIGRKGSRLEALAAQAVEELLHFCGLGVALPARQALWCLLPMTQAAGVSRLLIDKPNSALRAALNILNQLRPGCAKLDPAGIGFMLQIKGAAWPGRQAQE